MISKKILDGQAKHADMLAKLIMDGKNLKNLRLLSLSTHVSEEALLVMLKKMPFPNLEVVKIQS